MTTKKSKKSNTIILKLLPSVIAMMLILSVLVAYAWFYHGDIAGSMKFSLGTVNSEIWFFKAVDNNFNGIPELNPNTDSSPTKYDYTPSNSGTEGGNSKSLTLKYREEYLFNTESIKIADSKDSTFNTFELSLSDVYPSHVYTSKLSIVNNSSFSSTVSLSMHDGQYDRDTAFKLALFAVRIGTVDELGNVNFGQYTYLCDLIENNNFNQDIPFASSVMSSAASDSNTPSLEYWLQIKMLPFDDIKDRLADKFSEADSSITEDDLFQSYNALQGSEIILPELYIYFDVENAN